MPSSCASDSGASVFIPIIQSVGISGHDFESISFVALPGSSNSSSSSAPPAPKRQRVDDPAPSPQRPPMPPANSYAPVARDPLPPPQQQYQQEEPMPPSAQVHRRRHAPPPKDSLNRIKNLHNGMNLSPMTCGPPPAPPPQHFYEQMDRYRPYFDDRYGSQSYGYGNRSRERSGGWAHPAANGQVPHYGPHAPAPQGAPHAGGPPQNGHPPYGPAPQACSNNHVPNAADRRQQSFGQAAAGQQMYPTHANNYGAPQNSDPAANQESNAPLRGPVDNGSVGRPSMNSDNANGAM